MAHNRRLKLKWLDTISRDPRYSKEAYLFCMRAVRQAIKQRRKNNPVHGREIVSTSYAVAKEEFGPMARMVLEHWGIYSAHCIGDIVFRLAEEGILTKSDEDSIRDFEAGESMDRIFDPEKEYILAE